MPTSTSSSFRDKSKPKKDKKINFGDTFYSDDVNLKDTQGKLGHI